jgi:hypothetical protein
MFINPILWGGRPSELARNLVLAKPFAPVFDRLGRSGG